MRKLVTLQPILSLTPIKGADIIELAQIKGWKCIVQKGQFREGDLGLFFELDSFVPTDDPRFAFLRKLEREFPGTDKKGYLVKSIRMKGVLSQGLLLPTDAFPEIGDAMEKIISREEIAESIDDAIFSLDFAESLGVVKWEDETQAEDGMGPFPSFIPKTDLERVQNLPSVILDHGDEKFRATVKMDGMSATVYYLHPVNSHYDNERGKGEGYIGICSKNRELQRGKGGLIEDGLYSGSIIEELREYCLETGRSLALQCEVAGPGINKNREHFDWVCAYLHRIYDLDQNHFIKGDEFYNIMADIGLAQVDEYCGPKPLREYADTLENLISLADGDIGGARWDNDKKGFPREGLVFVSQDSDLEFKVISDKFLEYYGK